VLIDWFTVAAQIINFLILVALLKHFLYDRIIQAMDRREEKIRSRLQEAEDERKRAHEEAESYRRKNGELQNSQERILDEAREAADRKFKELTRKAREDVNTTRLRWQKSIEKEKNSFLQDLKRMTVQEVYAISRKVLKDLADTEFEERMVDMFLSRFRHLEKEKKDTILKSIKEEHKVVVRSGLELSPDSRLKITEMLQGEVPDKTEITYETDHQVIMGIELKSHGEKVVWSIRDYIAGLEDRAMAALERQIQENEGPKGPGMEKETGEKNGLRRKSTGKTKGGNTASIQETKE
jgi:F-type H+-transporting ATPase subunit b